MDNDLRPEHVDEELLDVADLILDMTSPERPAVARDLLRVRWKALADDILGQRGKDGSPRGSRAAHLLKNRLTTLERARLIQRVSDVAVVVLDRDGLTRLVDEDLPGVTGDHPSG